MSAPALDSTAQVVPPPVSTWDFVSTPEFWISLALGIAGLVFSVMSFLEARKAKAAAQLAGKAVKAQSTVAELTEVTFRLSQINESLSYTVARDILAEANKKVRRQIAAFRPTKDQEKVNTERKCSQLESAIDDLLACLSSAKGTLSQLKTPKGTPDAENDVLVYWEMEHHFSAIVDSISHFIGLLENLPPEELNH